MRASYLLVLLVGCATATSSTDLTGDAHPPIDARPGSDAAPHADGAVHPDGSPGVDAPAGSCATPVTGMIATWNFASASGSQTSTPSSAQASGVTAGDVSRSAGLVAAAGAMSINSTSWPLTATLDATKYYTFTVTPPAGCALDLTSMSIDTKASASGPASGAVATSADSFVATTSVATNSTTGMPSLAVSGATGPVEVRVYGYMATSASGTFRIENALILSGSLH